MSSVEASGSSVGLINSEEKKGRKTKLKKKLKSDSVALKQQQKINVKEDDVNMPSSTTTENQGKSNYESCNESSNEDKVYFTRKSKKKISWGELLHDPNRVD